MAYAATEDLNLSDQRLVELTENASSLGNKDTALLAVLLAESEAIVNGILSPVMPNVPFTGDVPPLVRVITSWIWAYRIYRHREVLDIPKSIMDDYAKAFEQLAGIVAGTIDAGAGDDVGGSNAALTAQAPSATTHRNRGWTC